MNIRNWGLAAALAWASLLALPAVAAERALDKEVVVKATLDQVWAAWTTREGIVSFFAPDARIEARVGGAFQIHFDPLAEAGVGGAFQIYIDPLAEPGAKGADDMRFLAIQPQRMISFDWNAPPSLPQARQQRSFVIVRFTPVDDQHTRVTLHHVGWGDGGEWDKAYTYFNSAWDAVLGNLRKRFEQGPQDWTEWMKRLEAMHKTPPKP